MGPVKSSKCPVRRSNLCRRTFEDCSIIVRLAPATSTPAPPTLHYTVRSSCGSVYAFTQACNAFGSARFRRSRGHHSRLCFGSMDKLKVAALKGFFDRVVLSFSQQISAIKLQIGSYMPRYFNLPEADVDDQSTSPTHIVAIRRKSGYLAANTMLLPCHVLLYVLQCG
jgi:hypothetical protein